MKTDGADSLALKWDAMESVEVDLKWRSLFRDWEGGATTSETLVDSESNRGRVLSLPGAVEGRPEGLEGVGEERSSFSAG